MKFIQTFKAASLMEKIGYVIQIGVALTFIVLLFGSLFQIFDNTLSKVVSTASAGWHTVGAVMIGVVAVYTYLLAKDKLPRRMTNVSKSVVFIVLVTLMVAAYCGFWGSDF